MKSRNKMSGAGDSWNNSLNHPPGFRGRRGINWFGLGLMYASYYMCRYNLPLASVEIQKQFPEIDNTRYGMIGSGRDLFYALGQFLNGLFTDKIGGKQAMAVGATLTVLLNLAFGFASYAGVGSALVLFVMIRATDGYAQAFGAPGMVKTNTAWFPRKERGRFAGIFGMMIQFGVITINALGPALLAGFTIPLFAVKIAPLHWRWLFFVPAGIVACVTVLMWLVVKNNPEEAGYHIVHEDDLRPEPNEKIRLWEVFKTIVKKPAVWNCAGAYFCTGIVRTALNSWWVLYFFNVWHVDIKSTTGAGRYVQFVAALMPLMATAGSLSSGFISDMLVRGKRAPVATGMYVLETVSILAAFLYLVVFDGGSLVWGGVFLLVVAFTCNSTHSIIGTAAAMDLGGRKMAGFASGVIDSFQYFGAFPAGILLGFVLDRFGWDAYFLFMLPFSLLGTLLMAWMWWRTRGTNAAGA